MRNRIAIGTTGAFVLAALGCFPPAEEPQDVTGAPVTSGATATSSQPFQDGVLIAQTYIEAPYDSVWRRFTDVEAFADWFSAPGLMFGAAPGDSVAWGNQDGVLYRGVLQRLEPGVGLTHTFSFTFVEPGEESVVDIQIVEAGPVTRVRIEHDCSNAPQTAQIISPVGWVKDLARLKTLLETGTPMPWPEDPA